MENKRFKKIYIEIINTCNLKCSFCKKGKRPASIMNKGNFKKVISQIKEYTNLIALHVKGEPLMHPELDEILKICEENEIMVNITTNGTLLKEKINSIKETKILRQINISLHSFEKNKSGYTKELEEYMKDIFEAIEILKENNNPYISYRLWNLDDISNNQENKQILKILEEKYKIENLFEKTKKNQFIKLDEKIFINQDVEFTWPDLNNENIKECGTCMGLRNQIAILCNGDVVPCCLDQDGIIKLGNIFKDDLDEVISSEKSLEIIKGFEENKLINKLCKTCGFPVKFEEMKKRNLL